MKSNEAEENCNTMDSQLASIHSKEENNFISGKIKMLYHNNFILETNILTRDWKPCSGLFYCSNIVINSLHRESLSPK